MPEDQRYSALTASKGQLDRNRQRTGNHGVEITQYQGYPGA